MSRIYPRAIIVALLVIQVITHLAWLPISAHSGQVAIPWMMNHGLALFDTLIEQHAPGSSLVGAVIQRMLPLEPVAAIQLANLVMVLAVTVLVYWLARRLASPLAGIAAALVWFWWEPVYGNVLLYFDTLLGLVLLLVAVIWLWPGERSWPRLLLMGLLLGAGTILKQHAWGAVLLVGLWLAVFYLRPRQLTAWVIGVLIAPVLLVAAMIAQDTLAAYLYWNWGFNLSGLMVNDPLSGDFLRKLLFTNALVPVFIGLPRIEVSGIPLVSRERGVKWLILALYLGGSMTLIPRPGEIHAMGQLPLLAVMSGVALAALIAYLRRVPVDAVGRAVVAGLLVFVALAWAWTGAAAYARTFVGIPAYDEFRPISDDLQARSQPGDTLFVLPETDSTPQLHPLSELLPPSTWIKGWFWYLAVPDVVENLLDEWAEKPPTYIVYFPDLIAEGEPDINPLVDFMRTHYELVARFEHITFHGPAAVYQWRGVG
ncbi:MAG: hypothetical protein K8L99_19995 [Anaerolineae bacterium]|nr:hypothetical protein [Anaerolineae bacterium]